MNRWWQRIGGGEAASVVPRWVAGIVGVVVVAAMTGGILLSAANNTSLDLFSIVGGASLAAVGMLLIARRPRNTLGWLLAALALLVSTSHVTGEYAVYGLLTRPGALPAPVLAAWYSEWFWIPMLWLWLVVVPLLSPSGRLPSPRWRPLLWLGIGVPAVFTVLAAVQGRLGIGFGEDPPTVDNPVGLLAFADVEASPVMSLMLLLLLGCIAGAVASVVVRLRRSPFEERQQLKWVAYGAAVSGCGMIVMAVGDAALGHRLPLDAVVIAAFPVGIGVAVLKYRLYDIDRIISRTLAWTLITGLLVGVYLAGAVVLGALLRPLVGQSDLAVAGSTLVVAALFGPLRRRVQAAVDRRFNRSRYDAQQTVEAFRARLRDKLDLDELSADLLATVEATVQPARSSVWLRTRSPVSVRR